MTGIELLILVGGCYALYTVGMAIATELDYRRFNRAELKELRRKNDELLAGLKQTVKKVSTQPPFTGGFLL